MLSGRVSLYWSALLTCKTAFFIFSHPMGATGARQIATLMPELKRTNQKYGLISMCVGIGMGVAAVVERE